MSARIRLARHGCKKRPFYRIVVADSAAPRSGKFIEVVGTYDPNKEPAAVELKEDKIKNWLGKGVLPTATVKSILKKAGVSLKEEAAA